MLTGVAVATTLALGVAGGPAEAASRTYYGGTAAGSWTPSDGAIFAMASVGGKIIVAGSFTSWRSSSGQTVGQKYLAALDPSSGALITSWRPTLNATARTVATSGGVLFVGGDFTTVNGSSRPRIAALSAGTGAPSSWRVDVSGPVRDMVVAGSSLYFGGSFTSVNGLTRHNAAAAALSNAAVSTTWVPNPNGAVRALAAIPGAGKIVLGGKFTKLKGQNRRYVGIVNTGGGLASWIPNQSASDCEGQPTEPCIVLDLAATSTRVYAGLSGPGGRVYAWDLNGNRVWQQRADGDVQAVEFFNSTLYVGGHFDPQFGGSGSAITMRSGFAALDAANGSVLPYAPINRGGLNTWDILADGSRLRMGGEFRTVNGANRRGYVQYSAVSSPDTTAPGVPGKLTAKATSSTSVKLTWTAASGGVANYRVYRVDVGTGEKYTSVIKVTTTFTDSSVKKGHKYQYWVGASDSALNVSKPSSMVTVSTP